MPKLSSDQAFQLANQFHDLSVAVGNERFDQWDELTPAQRKRLEDLQWTLMNYSSDFTAQAINFVVDDLQGTLAKITGADATVLGAAIMSGNADGALKAAGDLVQAASA